VSADKSKAELRSDRDLVNQIIIYFAKYLLFIITTHHNTVPIIDSCITIMIDDYYSIFIEKNKFRFLDLGKI